MTPQQSQPGPRARELVGVFFLALVVVALLAVVPGAACGLAVRAYDYARGGAR